MSRSTGCFARRLRDDRSGAIAVIVALSAGFFLGLCAIVIDVAYLIDAQRFLQASADAAALAGGQYINCCDDGGAKADSTALAYSAVGGGRNARPGLTVTMASGYPLFKCLSSTGVACGTDSANAVVVKENAVVPLFFAQLFGYGTIQLTATATASAKGGTPIPLDVVLIVDTTASMNTNDPNCSNPSLSRVQCALAGFQTLLGALQPSGSDCTTGARGACVALMTFPGFGNAAQAGYEYCATGTPPTITAYNQSPVYQVLDLSQDYQNPDHTLNTGSDLVLAAQADPAACAGLQAIGGVGTFYADAIAAAQSYLSTDGRTGVQKAIILLSDGDANAPTAPTPTNECQQGVAAAQSAAAAGTWVYSIAYGSPTSGSCSTDGGAITACQAMQQIASDPSKYYSDDQGSEPCASGANPITDLNQIFGDIGIDLTNARLVPDNTT